MLVQGGERWRHHEVALSDQNAQTTRVQRRAAVQVRHSSPPALVRANMLDASHRAQSEGFTA